MVAYPNVMRFTAKKFAHSIAALTFLLSYGTLVLIWGNRTHLQLSAASLSDPPPSYGHAYGHAPAYGQHTSNTSNYNDYMRFHERAPRSVLDSHRGNNNDPKISEYITPQFHVNNSLRDNAERNENPHNFKEQSKTRLTNLNDIFISVKTTKSFHKSRLDVIIRTWFVLAKDQTRVTFQFSSPNYPYDPHLLVPKRGKSHSTYFFTDGDDPLYNERTHGHLINTNCSSSHNRKALCCKMSVEFDKFLQSDKRWFCHFDDDNYVNIPRLVKLLGKYNSLEDWYLGKPSIRQPLEILNRDNVQKKISFWFATGGAGFCLSRSLALKMMPLASDGKFISIGERIRLPDDVTLGYIVEHLLGKKLTVVDKFHSHLEPMKFLKLDSLSDQVTFSYSRYGHEMNVLSIDEGIDQRIDPTRFLSLHCYLFPNFSFCPK